MIRVLGRTIVIYVLYRTTVYNTYLLLFIYLLIFIINYMKTFSIATTVKELPTLLNLLADRQTHEDKHFNYLDMDPCPQCWSRDRVTVHTHNSLYLLCNNCGRKS